MSWIFGSACWAVASSLMPAKVRVAESKIDRTSFDIVETESPSGATAGAGLMFRVGVGVVRLLSQCNSAQVMPTRQISGNSHRRICDPDDAPVVATERVVAPVYAGRAGE